MKCPYCKGEGEFPAETVGQLVLAYRQLAGMTQLEVSTGAGLARSQIANIEAERTDVPIKTLARIAKALGVTTKDLVP